MSAERVAEVGLKVEVLIEYRCAEAAVNVGRRLATLVVRSLRVAVGNHLVAVGVVSVPLWLSVFRINTCPFLHVICIYWLANLKNALCCTSNGCTVADNHWLNNIVAVGIALLVEVAQFVAVV